MKHFFIKKFGQWKHLVGSLYFFIFFFYKEGGNTWGKKSMAGKAASKL